LITVPKRYGQTDGTTSTCNLITALCVTSRGKNIGKIVIKFLQGSVVTSTTMGGQTIHRSVANFL